MSKVKEKRNALIKELKEAFNKAEDDNHEVHVAHLERGIVVTFTQIDDCVDCDCEGKIEDQVDVDEFEYYDCKKCEGNGYLVIKREFLIGQDNKEVNNDTDRCC